MVHVANLKMESLRYQELKSRLQAEFTAVDAKTIADTLEGITDLHEMIAAVIRSALVDEALHAGLRLHVDNMTERLSRFELRASKKRQLALEAMTEAGLSKLEQPGFTASARAEADARRAIDEDAFTGPAEAGAETAEEADVVTEVGIPLDAIEDVRTLQIVAGMHTTDELIIGIVGDAELGTAQIVDREVATI